ncbi:hypothetical protein CXR34_00415 [Microbacterium hominis]|uniref:Uncharacterized protein n=1 Tax=Microbacterium hominis TaxID=162426 RepID=A0A2K9D5C9_9MICO|nr:hypothetical protein CXR34_00415 [Microbacterium hominis]
MWGRRQRSQCRCRSRRCRPRSPCRCRSRRCRPRSPCRCRSRRCRPPSRYPSPRWRWRVWASPRSPGAREQPRRFRGRARRYRRQCSR